MMYVLIAGKVTKELKTLANNKCVLGLILKFGTLIGPDSNKIKLIYKEKE